MKVYLWVVISLCFLSSCDPGFNECMKVKNISGKTLVFYIQKNAKYRLDSLGFRTYNRDLALSFSSETDSVLWIRAIVPSGKEISIHDDGGIGYIHYSDSQTATAFFNDRFDTVFVENFFLSKDLFDFNLWTQDVETQKLSSKAIFSTIIARGDIR
ncbi:MAG: hypothetical protein WAT79_04545 [Saprospiraceae bacterium]